MIDDPKRARDDRSRQRCLRYDGKRKAPNAIRYALPPIEKAPLDQSAKRALAVISRQLTQLVRLVDDLLDVTRITSGKIALKRERVTLDVVIHAALESVSPVINAARHAFEVVMPDEPLPVEVDPDRVSQVIGNLLANAAKYTPRGGKITLDVSRDVDDAVVRVMDNGMGIPRINCRGCSTCSCK